MYYAKFRNVSGTEQVVLFAQGRQVIQHGVSFWGEVEQLGRDARFQRIREILPTARYDFSSWEREAIIKTLYRMGVEFSQYALSSGQLVELIRSEYTKQQEYLKEHGEELRDQYYKSRGGLQTPKDQVQAKSPIPSPTDMIKEETKRQLTEYQTEPVNTTIEHNPENLTPNTDLGERIKEKKQEAFEEFKKDNDAYVDAKIEDIRQRRKIENSKKFDLRKLNLDMMLIFLDKFTDEDWKDYDYVDNKWKAFDKIKSVGKESDIKDFELKLELVHSEYTERASIAPKKWTAAKRETLITILEKMDIPLDQHDYDEASRTEILNKAKASFELYKRDGLSLEHQKHYMETDEYKQKLKEKETT
jgi:hypothetical protein